jgi:hypothetical protein
MPMNVELDDKERMVAVAALGNVSGSGDCYLQTNINIFSSIFPLITTIIINVGYDWCKDMAIVFDNRT